MKISLRRVAHAFLALTAIVVTLAVLHVWEISTLSSATMARIAVTYLLLSALLGVSAAVAHFQEGAPRNRDGDRLVD